MLELPPADDLPAPKYRDLHQLEGLVGSLASELASLERNMDSIRSSYVRTLENYSVLRKMNDLWAAIDLGELGEVTTTSVAAATSGDVELEVEVGGQGQSGTGTGSRSGQINSITGLIAAEKMMPLERMLWRFFGRNIYVKVITLEEPLESPDAADDYAYRKVFTVYYKGEKHIGIKLRKLCDAFKAQIFELSASVAEREAAMSALERQMADQRMVLTKSRDYYYKVC